MPQAVRLRLKKREDRRIAAGHLWVFSNEIDTSLTPVKGIEPGSAAILESASGKFLAHAYVNPVSLISARITSRSKHVPFSATLLRDRLQSALDLRERTWQAPFYRWVHGEGDFLPGLVVDRYAGVAVVQITTAGMEHYREEIVDALVSIGSLDAVELRNDSGIRELEGLPLYREWAFGSAVDELVVEENGLQYRVPVDAGQKTGWFYDHRDSRMALRQWVRGCDVLDVYSYMGGFGINAAAGGASRVVALDASQRAVDAARENAGLNDVDSVFTAYACDAVEYMREMFADNQRFDVVALDPPAFIKRKKDRDAGMRHYALNNRLAMKLLKPGGILLSASCSQALDRDALQQCIRRAMPTGIPGVQVLHSFMQAGDHPVNLCMPETLYLKGVIARLAHV